MGRGPAAAVDALSAAVGAQPGRADLWSELATALVAAGRAPEAWDAAVRAVELAPRSAASHRAIGSVAAALTNIGTAPGSVGTTSAALGLPNDDCFHVRDLWEHSESESTGAIGPVEIPPHGVAMFRVTRCG